MTPDSKHLEIVPLGKGQEESVPFARGFRTALSFLTILPVGDRYGQLVASVGGRRVAPSTTLYFPVVGAILGLILWALAWVLPENNLLSAALILSVWTILTGGLHEDGWADCADAALPPVSPERRLEILADPRIGAHGLVAVLMLVLLRVTSIPEVPIWALFVAPILGRIAMVWSLGLGRPLRPGGLGAFFATSARPVWATIVALLFLSGAFFLGAPLPELMLGLSVGGLVATGVGLFLAERFQGLSGDGHGAVGLAAETGLLCALALSNLAGV